MRHVRAAERFFTGLGINAKNSTEHHHCAVRKNAVVKTRCESNIFWGGKERHRKAPK